MKKNLTTVLIIISLVTVFVLAALSYSQIKESRKQRANKEMEGLRLEKQILELEKNNLEESKNESYRLDLNESEESIVRRAFGESIKAFNAADDLLRRKKYIAENKKNEREKKWNDVQIVDSEIAFREAEERENLRVSQEEESIAQLEKDKEVIEADLSKVKKKLSAIRSEREELLSSIRTRKVKMAEDSYKYYVEYQKLHGRSYLSKDSDWMEKKCSKCFENILYYAKRCKHCTAQQDS